MLRKLPRLLLLAALTTAPFQPALASPTARPGAWPAAEPSAPEAIAPAPTGCTLTTSSFFNASSLPIADTGTLTATVTVSGMGPVLWDLNLTTNLAHTDSDDLDVFLRSPSGTLATITTDNGNNRQNVFNGTVWDDQGGSAVSDRFFVSDTPVSPLVPEEAMAAFRGENPNGVWTLTIQDDTANASTGQHSGWGLQVTTLPVVPNKITYTLFDDQDHAIPDFGYLMRTMNTNNFAPATLGELKLTTEIEHDRNNDLDVYLVSPTGITVTITTDSGGDLANGFRNVTWWDRAGTTNPPGPVSDAAFDNNISRSPMVAEGALAAFNGLNPNGTWKLLIEDDLPLNTGTLDSWKVELTGYDCLPDLSVMQSTAEAPYVELGTPVTFTLAVGNVSSVAAPDVAFSFALSAGATLLAEPAPNGWQCTTAPTKDAFECTQGVLSGGLTSGFDVAVLAPAVPGQVTASIEASTSATESSLANNATETSAYVGLFSDNGQPWPVSDNHYDADDGAILDGGQGAFTEWGGLRLRVHDASFDIVTDNAWLADLDLTYRTSRRWSSSANAVYSGVAVGRHIWAPAHTNWLRYVDIFTNTTSANRDIVLAWGGLLGSGSQTTVAATSTGDTTLNAADAWAVTIANDGLNANGPANQPPVGYLMGSAAKDIYYGAFDWMAGPFSTAWSGNGNDNLAHGHSFLLPPQTTVAVVVFLYRGLAEGVPGPEGCTSNCVTPAAGTQITLAQSVLIGLEDNPPLCDLPASVRAVITNWPEEDTACEQVFLPIGVR